MRKNKVRKFLSILTGGVLTALPLAADQAAETRMGVAALAAGDYANAVTGLRAAMEQADRNDDASGWAEIALKLGDACLRRGDLSGARAVYTEFRRRHPLRSAGTLPGKLLAAEGKYAEAEQAFAALIAGDPARADEARFCQGAVKMSSGDLAGAQAIFAELGKKSGPWAAQARYEAVYALIRLNRSAAALAALGEIPEAERHEQWDLLRFMAEAYSGKLTEFRKQYTAFIGKSPALPPGRLLELLSVAARAAEKLNDTDFAVQCLNTALDLATGEMTRRELARRLIGVYAAKFPERAAEEARRYARVFPGAPDRGKVLNRAGRRLAAAGKSAAALEMFASVARDRNLPDADRLEAAADAVAAAERLTGRDPAEFYRMLSEESPAARDRADWKLRFGSHLERKGDRAGALREYRSALNIAPPSDRERMHFALLNYFIRMRNDAEVRKEAEFLSGAARPEHRAAAHFALGKLAEKTGSFTAARRFYREAAGLRWEHRDAAEFQAALMSLFLREPAAAREFAAFAESRPRSPLAAEAWYHAAAAYHEAGDAKAADHAAKKLESDYPRSPAWAFYVLNRARDRGDGGDLAGAVAELKKYGADFSGTPAGAEFALWQAVYLDRGGKTAEALPLLLALLQRKDLPAPLRAEAAWHLGEIEFRRGRYPDAREFFLRSCELDPGTVSADAAVGRAVDCDLIDRATPDPVRLRAAAARCRKLAEETSHPGIRLQALYKLGQCRESEGNTEAALDAYGKVLSAAADLRTQGVVPEAQWCVRAAEAALDILLRHRPAGAWGRAGRLCARLDKLGFAEVSGAKIWENFNRQFDATRRK